jgi:hypothetical protein
VELVGKMKSRKAKIILWMGMGVIFLAAFIVIAGIHYVHRHIPAEIIPDIRAAIAARNIPDPNARVAKYLEGLYGPMSNPTNRERAFEDFFNPNHIKAMRLIVKHSPAAQRRSNIQATASWLANYRTNMTPQEKADLENYFQSTAGKAALRAATAQYMSQNPLYRNATAPVIMQLMTTLVAVKK